MTAACSRDPLPQPALRGNGLLSGGDTFVEASLGDATRINPLLTSDSATGDIVNYVYSGLIRYDKNLKFEGELARSWEIKRGGLEILFRLRPNVRWHDGVPFTAKDVVYTYKKLIDPETATPFGADFMDVKSVEAVDDLTVRVTYKKVFSPALESWGMGIIPEHVYKTGPINSHPANRAPIGTGPYKFVEWKTDEKIVLEANPDYFEGKPGMRRIVYRIIPDLSVQFLELRNQSIDTMGLTPDQFGAYPAFFRAYQKFRYPSFSYGFFAFNLDHPFFKDIRVRRALAHAVDKRDIIQGVLLGFGRPATGPFPPSLAAADPTVPDLPYDVEKAKALLSEAGWSDADGDGVLDKDGKPFRFTIITNQGNKTRELTATIMQAHLAKVGVKADVRILEWSAFIHDYVNKRRFDAMVLGWNLSRDPDQYVMWHSSQRGPGKYNFVGYANPVVDRLLEEGRVTYDEAKRTAIYRRIHRQLAEDLPYIFLYFPEALPVVHKRIHNVEVAPAGLGWNFRNWYVPEDQQKYPVLAP